MKDELWFRAKVLILIILFPILWPLSCILEELEEGAREYKKLWAMLLFGRKWWD